MQHRVLDEQPASRHKQDEILSVNPSNGIERIMIFESMPWKEELHSLIDQLASTTLPLECNEDDKSGFIAERALIYSAFVARLLIDAKKTTDPISGHNISVGVISNKLENPEHVQPLLRRFPEHDYYDFENEVVQSVSCRRILNQIIHSFIIPTFEVGEDGAILGIFVASDQSANDKLYHVKLESWIGYLESIANDDITTMEARFDQDKGKWIETRR